MKFTSVQFMTAAEKEKVVKNLKSFLKNDFSLTTFTKALYNHLTLHCGFIAHFDLHGYYHTYFTTPEGKKQWAANLLLYNEMAEYADVNSVLKRMVDEHMRKSIKSLNEQAKERDIATAKALLQKHGMGWNGELVQR